MTCIDEGRSICGDHARALAVRRSIGVDRPQAYRPMRTSTTRSAVPSSAATRSMPRVDCVCRRRAARPYGQSTGTLQAADPENRDDI